MIHKKCARPTCKQHGGLTVASHSKPLIGGKNQESHPLDRGFYSAHILRAEVRTQEHYSWIHDLCLSQPESSTRFSWSWSSAALPVTEEDIAGTSQHENYWSRICSNCGHSSEFNRRGWVCPISFYILSFVTKMIVEVETFSCESSGIDFRLKMNFLIWNTISGTLVLLRSLDTWPLDMENVSRNRCFIVPKNITEELSWPLKG